MGLSVLLLEKDAVYGGTTARSGGVLWIPNNPISIARPEPDSLEAARAYLRHECGAHYDEARIEAFLAHGPRMVDFFMKETDVQLIPLPEYPDYHAESPGGRVAGRSIMAAPLDGRELGKRIKDRRRAARTHGGPVQRGRRRRQGLAVPPRLACLQPLSG
jgi:succinate dehydrogenase/fumarate reductase flavoprotein subunit